MDTKSSRNEMSRPLFMPANLEVDRIEMFPPESTETRMIFLAVDDCCWPSGSAGAIVDLEEPKLVWIDPSESFMGYRNGVP